MASRFKGQRRRTWLRCVTVALLACMATNNHSSAEGAGRAINRAGLDLIEEFEGFFPNYYYDVVNVKTIGYGHTCQSDGCVGINPPLSKAQATDLLQSDLRKSYSPCVERTIKRPLNDNQFAALVSFTYNLGCGALQSSSLARRLNAGGNPSTVAAEEFIKWNRAGGRVFAGLTRRRKAEAALFNTPSKGGNTGTTKPPKDGATRPPKTTRSPKPTKLPNPQPTETEEPYTDIFPTTTDPLPEPQPTETEEPSTEIYPTTINPLPEPLPTETEEPSTEIFPTIIDPYPTVTPAPTTVHCGKHWPTPTPYPTTTNAAPTTSRFPAPTKYTPRPKPSSTSAPTTKKSQPKPSNTPAPGIGHGSVEAEVARMLKKRDQAYDHGVKTLIETVTIQGKPVETRTAIAFLKMSRARGTPPIRINSGFRTMAQQQYLYNCYLTGSCNNGNLAARPGYSNHQNGKALDLDVTSGATYQWLARNAHKYGFVRTVPSEKWHWEYRPGTRRASYT